MKKNKLNRFIILSVAFHVVLISAVLLYFFRNPLSGGKPGTVMVGIISTGDSAQSDPALSAKTNNSESSKPKNNPKVALKQKPLETIKNQKSTNQRIQNQPANTTKKKVESTNQIKPAFKSNASEKNNSKTGTQVASRGHEGHTESKNLGINGSDKTLAYPNYNVNPKPKYPRVARKRGYEGEVKLKVFVLSDGKVGKIEVLSPSGYKVLDDEAIEAVKSWIFIPGKQNGQEISSWVTVPITFQLKNS